VYLGQQAEYAAMDQAVRATAGQVLVYGGGFASAVYSANGAGVSATPSEGFGTPDAAYPYLRAVPYETHSPETWQVRIALTDLAGRLAYRGAISDVRPASVGPSGRATSVTISGSAGDKTLPALSFAGALGLRSTKWAVHVEQAAAPPPPPAAELIQTLPDDVPTTPTTAAHRAAPASSGGQSRTLPATIAVAALATIGFLSRKPLMRRRSSHKPG
jgi:SpoIID/LytB domain protein